MFTRFIAALGVALLAPVGALAAATDLAYAGPTGWSHVDMPPAPDASRVVSQWHIAGDIATVTYMKDTTTPFADALANIHKNFSDHAIKPSIDKDVPCRGTAAHVIEFATGPDGKKVVINRMLVPTGPGVSTITYVRADGTKPDGDVTTSVAAFCNATP